MFLLNIGLDHSDGLPRSCEASSHRRGLFDRHRSRPGHGRQGAELYPSRKWPRRQRYARFFRVDYEWLMTGRGEMRARTASEAGVPVDGFVRDGAVIDPGGAARQESSEIILPAESALGAFVVAGDSQRPRFLDGEIILYDRRPVSPDTLVDRIAIVQIADGRKMIKIIRRADAARWRLEWHNAPAEEAVELLAAWRYVGSLAGR
jgi:hypothetical protein